MTPNGWVRVARADFALSFAYPSEVDGREVINQESVRPDFGRIHLSTKDKLGLYFEVTRFDGIDPRTEYDSHRAYLEQRFGAGAVAELAGTTFQGRPGMSYSFHWENNRRMVILLAVGGDTYRLLYDPTIERNEDVLATVEVLRAEDPEAESQPRDA